MSRTHKPRAELLLLALAVALLLAVVSQAPEVDNTAAAQGNPTEVPVGGRIEAEDACYIRLPDMPAARYGGFGAYNPETGVLAFAGGAEKKSADNTWAYYQLYAYQLDGSMTSWKVINYGNNVGYTQEPDKGCREMTSVQIENDRWVSVFGKDGCDNGRLDESSAKGGDIVELQVGTNASQQQVKWVPNSGVTSLDNLPTLLADEKGKLVRPFATWDSNRNRLIVGQGTFDDAYESETRDELYQATKQGSKWKVSELRPDPPIPERRFSSCAAYVYDQDAGVDGVLVLGGQGGGEYGESHKEVWWLDFSSSAQGAWMDITAKFSNMDTIGYRRGGACAYNPDTKTFYSWMGRADGGIPEGSKRSAGLWSVDLSNLGDSGATFTWQRHAPDNLAGINGRRLIPSVYDWDNNRIFAMGGRNDLDSYADTWVIYPGVTGSACQNLDPNAPHQKPTEVPKPTRTPGGAPVEACDFLSARVPQAVIDSAVANPGSVQGYNVLQNPGVPESPWNVRRTKLSVRNIAAPWHPLYNGLTYKAGCP